MAKKIRRGGLPPDKYLSEEQEGRLRDWLEIRSRNARLKKRTRAIDNQFIIEFMLDTGLRSEETVYVKIEDTPVIHGKESLEVYGKGGIYRTVLLSDECIERIKAYVKERRKGCKPGSALIVSEKGYRRIVVRRRIQKNKKKRIEIKIEYSARLKYDSLKKRVARVGEKCGIGKLRPHMLRHTFGVKTYATENDIVFTADQMGHASTKTTEIYAKTRNEARRRQAKSINNSIPRRYGSENRGKQES